MEDIYVLKIHKNFYVFLPEEEQRHIYINVFILTGCGSSSVG